MTACDCCQESVPIVVSVHLSLCDGCARDLYGDPGHYGQHDMTAIPVRHRYNLGRALWLWAPDYPLQRMARHRADDDSPVTVAELADRIGRDLVGAATIRTDRRLP